MSIKFAFTSLPISLHILELITVTDISCSCGDAHRSRLTATDLEAHYARGGHSLYSGIRVCAAHVGRLFRIFGIWVGRLFSILGIWVGRLFIILVFGWVAKTQ
jgi:hypothetical protein